MAERDASGEPRRPGEVPRDEVFDMGRDEQLRFEAQRRREEVQDRRVRQQMAEQVDVTDIDPQEDVVTRVEGGRVVGDLTEGAQQRVQSAAERRAERRAEREAREDVAEQLSQEHDVDVDPEDVEVSDGSVSVDEGVRRQIASQQAADEISGEYGVDVDAGDVEVEDGGNVTLDEDAKQEIERQQVAEAAGVDPDDVVRVREPLDHTSALERALPTSPVADQTESIEADWAIDPDVQRQRAAESSEVFDTADFEVTVRGGKPAVQPREEAQERVARERIAEQEGIDPDRLDLVQEEGQWRVTEDTQRELAQEQIAEEEGVSPDDVTVEREGDEWRAEIDEDGALDRVQGGAMAAIDDPVGAVDTAVGGVTSAAITAPWAVGKAVDDPVGAAKGAGETAASGVETAGEVTYEGIVGPIDTSGFDASVEGTIGETLSRAEEDLPESVDLDIDTQGFDASVEGTIGETASRASRDPLIQAVDEDRVSTIVEGSTGAAETVSALPYQAQTAAIESAQTTIDDPIGTAESAVDRARNVDPVDAGVVGAAGLVAFPEPATSAVGGAALLGAGALGVGAAQQSGALDNIEVPEITTPTRSDDRNVGEISVPTVPASRQSQGEIDAPSDSEGGGEIDVPEEPTSGTGGEIDVPDDPINIGEGSIEITAQQMVGDLDQTRDERARGEGVTSGIIGEEIAGTDPDASVDVEEQQWEHAQDELTWIQEDLADSADREREAAEQSIADEQQAFEPAGEAVWEDPETISRVYDEPVEETAEAPSELVDEAREPEVIEDETGFERVEEDTSFEVVEEAQQFQVVDDAEVDAEVAESIGPTPEPTPAEDAIGADDIERDYLSDPVGEPIESVANDVSAGTGYDDDLRDGVRSREDTDEALDQTVDADLREIDDSIARSTVDADTAVDPIVDPVSASLPTGVEVPAEEITAPETVDLQEFPELHGFQRPPGRRRRPRAPTPGIGSDLDDLGVGDDGWVEERVEFELPDPGLTDLDGLDELDSFDPIDGGGR